MKIRKELWFGFILMALIVCAAVGMLIAVPKVTNGHIGLLMLSLVVVAIMLGKSPPGPASSRLRFPSSRRRRCSPKCKAACATSEGSTASWKSCARDSPSSASSPRSPWRPRRGLHCGCPGAMAGILKIYP